MSDLPSNHEQLRMLRELLLSPAREEIRQVKAEMEQKRLTASEVSEVLADAVRHTTTNGDKLGKALGPTLSEAFRDSVQRNPKALADSIAPIMGPAIRRSIQEAIRSMVQSLNTIVDHSLSPQGMRWRWEAWRSGKPFGEVVLLHTLIYRIEQVWLVDRRTGLMMQHVSIDPQQNMAAMSSMLSAIQEFVRDSFHGDELETMRFGGRMVWIQHGPLAYLAAAFRGDPPISIRAKLQSVLESIHVEHADLLRQFHGDTTPMEIVRPDLDQLLKSEFIERDVAIDKTPVWRKNISWAIPTACVMLASVFFGVQWRQARYHNYLARELDLPSTVQVVRHEGQLQLVGKAYSEDLRRAENRLYRLNGIQGLETSGLELLDRSWLLFLDLLRAEPGFEVMSAERVRNRFVVRGLRDPHAVHADQLIQQVGLSPTQVEQHWKPYRSLEIPIVALRLRERIAIPANISLSTIPDRLVVEGAASEAWLASFRQAASELDVLDRVDCNQVRIVPEDEFTVQH